MDWKKFWNQHAQNSNELKQVARIVNGKELSIDLLEEITQNIIHLLDLKPEDTLLDLCCGNGLLTHQLSKYCKQVDAVDISDQLIREAIRKYNSGKIQFTHADVLEYLSTKKYDKILLYFSFQYMDTYQKGFKVLENITKMSHSDTIILIGDIPDRIKLNVFYPTFLERLKYHIKNLYLNSDMGKFWKKDELDSICSDLKLKGEFIKQQDWQPYSKYRFDYLIKPLI